MSAIIVRQKNENEPDLLTGNEFGRVVVIKKCWIVEANA